mgnify:CR=1 FL=1
MVKNMDKRALICTAVFLALLSGLYFSGHGYARHFYEGAAASPISKYQININTATVEELVLLDSLGEKTAQAIINHRDENGAFQSIEEIQNVKGIGEKKFSLWKQYLSVS